MDTYVRGTQRKFIFVPVMEKTLVELW